jgi:hypothetical protein
MPKLLFPGGIFIAVKGRIRPSVLRAPRAIVPSWQERQSFEAPFGWPTAAFSVEL